MFIIKFIFFLFLFFLVTVAFIAFKLYWKFRQLTKGYRQDQPFDRQTDAYHQRQQADGSVVIDQRQPQQQKRKIIDDDEGEYVDFEEQS